MLKKGSRKFRVTFKQVLIGLFLILIGFCPVPYVVEMPGDGFDAAGFLQVDQAQEDQGEFLVMTVASFDATIFSSLVALLPFHSLEPIADIYGDSTGEEYFQVQSYYMESSRNNAIYYAYQAAGKDVQLETQGIFVMSVIDGSNFAQTLQIGDVIHAIDEHQFTNATEFTEYIKGKNVGDTVSISFERNGQQMTTSGALMQHPETQQAALGITLVVKTEVIANPAVSFETHNVTGPSAGLIFSLEIYDQLTEGNLTKGQIIAGTGTLDESGTVGRIGGVSKKVVAAHRRGATIFFVPDDDITEEMRAYDATIQSNYQEALQTAEELKTNMKIVPVKSFEDAIDYLKSME